MPDDAQNADNSKLRMSSAGKARLRKNEDPKYYYYDDGGRLGRGNCTWGIGTLAHKGPCTAAELKTKVGLAEVEAAFTSRIADAERIVRRKVSRQTLSQEQFDALVNYQDFEGIDMRFSDWFSTARQGAARPALAVLLFAARAPWPAGAADMPVEPNVDIYGKWRLAKVLDSADIAAMSDRQAKAMLGEEVLIANDRFKIGKRTCEGPSYERSVDDLARSFREDGHVSSVNMGLPDPVTSIDAGCTHIYLKASGRIVVHWDGFYFDAVRKGH